MPITQMMDIWRSCSFDLLYIAEKNKSVDIVVIMGFFIH